MRFASRALFVLAVCASTVVLRAQAPAGAPMVQLNVVALDSDGNPVTGLTADDFKITDQGTAQRVAFLHRTASPLPAPAASAPTR